jgi:hypothetical protein
MSLLKKLAKPLAPVIAAAALFTAAPQKATAGDFYLRASGEVLNSLQQSFKDVYGDVIFLANIGVGYDSGNVRSELNFKFGEPSESYTNGSDTAEAKFYYGDIDARVMKDFVKDSDFRVYAGLEGAFNFVREEIDVNGQAVWNSGLLTGWSGGLFAGVDYQVWKNSFIFGEVAANYGAVSLGSGSFTPGGVSIRLGSRLKL